MENKTITFFCLFFLVTFSLSSVSGQNFLIPEREILTSGANDWKSFYIGENHYIAVASFQDNSSVEINSAIFNVDSGFDTVQLIPTSGASDWEYFSINGAHYLGVANFINNQGNYLLDSEIYRFENGLWQSFQHIPTKGAYDLEFLDDGTHQFLAVANQRESESGYFIDSDIYQWNGDSLVLLQHVGTYGATDWEGFMLNGDPCFAVANTFFAASQIYKYNGENFEILQSIPSLGATGIEVITVDNEIYLALANGRSLFSYTTNSEIYRFNGSQFDVLQPLETTGAFDWEYFSFDGRHFLACAEYRDDDDNYNLYSRFFRFENNVFEKIDEVLTHGAVDWEFLDDNDEPAIIVANYKLNGDHNTNSILYHFDRNALHLEEQKYPSNIKIYPNPAAEIIHFQGVPVGAEFTVFDTFGRVVKHCKNNENQSLNVSSWIPGVYHIVFSVGSRSISFVVAQ